MLCRNAEKWLYKLEQDFAWNCGKSIPEDMSFPDQKGKVRLVLRKNGDITVMEGYAWDGCTPKFCLLDILVGVPDGAIDTRTGKPKTYYASLVHDALLQFIPDGVPFKQKEIDLFFLRLMEETDFALRHLYYRGVWIFGIFWHWLSVNFGKKRKVNAY